MTYQPRTGTVGLSGVKAQGVVSLAIRLGSVLRHEKTAGIMARTVFLVTPPTAAVLSALAGASAIVVLLVFVIALLIAVAMIVIVAALFGFASRDKQWFSHSFIVHHVDLDGTVWITEATGGGVVTRHMHYKPGEFVWLATDSLLSGDDADEVRAFLDAVCEARWSYDYGTFAGLAVYAITGAMLAPAGVGTAICSGLTSEALTRGKAIWPLPAYRMMPQDQFWFAIGNGVAVVET